MNKTSKPDFSLTLSKEQELIIKQYLNDEITLRELTRLWGDVYPQKTLNHIHNIIKELYKQGILTWTNK